MCVMAPWHAGIAGAQYHSPPGPLQVKYGSARSYIFATACVFRMECFNYKGMYTKVCYEKNMTTHLGLHTVEELY